MDAISGLPRLRWRGIYFPFDDLTTDTAHRQVAHHMPDKDGAKLEDMGIDARMVSGHCMFLNGVVFEPGGYSVPWFPDVFNRFIAACNDKTTGDLVHPTKGTMRCKVSSFKETLKSAPRDGAVVDVIWKEDTEDNAETVAESRAAPLSEAIAAARSVDSGVAAIKAVHSSFKPSSFSFSDALTSIRSAVDTATLISKKGAGMIARAQYQLNALQDSVDALRDATLNQVRKDIERLRAALYAVQRTMLVTKPVTYYVVPKDATLAGLAVRLKCGLSDLLTLNTNLAGVPIVPARTVLRYYAVS